MQSNVRRPPPRRTIPPSFISIPKRDAPVPPPRSPCALDGIETLGEKMAEEPMSKVRQSALSVTTQSPIPRTLSLDALSCPFIAPKMSKSNMTSSSTSIQMLATQVSSKRQQPGTPSGSHFNTISEIPNNKLGDGYGQFCDPWKLGKVIGRGQFGTVYLATNLSNGQQMAVKQLSIHSVEMLEGLIEEVVLMCRASFRNPNVVQCMGWSVSHNVANQQVTQTMIKSYSLEELDRATCVGGFFNIFMEYLPRGSLASYMQENGPLDQITMRNFIRQLLLGLRSLHAAGIAHRDIKCQNLLLTENNLIKVADFGSAKKVALRTEGSQSTITGSVPWMPPEVIKQNVGIHEGSRTKGWKLADVWAIGCVVLEMLTGKPPWNNFSNPAAMMFAIASTKSHPPIPETINLHDHGIDFIKKCCALNAVERPPVANLLYHPYMRQGKLHLVNECLS